MKRGLNFIISFKHLNQLSPIFLSVFALIFSSSACAEKTFADLRVYASDSGTIDKFYDVSNDEIIADNVWIFRPDGSYSAVVVLDGEHLMLSGKYAGDDVGHDFMFSIDTDGDEQYDEQLYGIDEFQIIEWRHESGTLKFMLVK